MTTNNVIMYGSDYTMSVFCISSPSHHLLFAVKNDMEQNDLTHRGELAYTCYLTSLAVILVNKGFQSIS